MFKNFINDGISFVNNQFEFDFNNDKSTDIVKLAKPTLKTITANGLIDVVHFVYKPELNALKSDIYTKFITYLKSGNFKDDTNKRKFINNAIAQLTDSINIFNVSTILYPQSRSNINIELVKSVRLASATQVYSFELIKELPENIDFDFDNFSNEELHMLNVDGSKKYNRSDRTNIIRSIKNMIAKTKSMQYFSIASAGKAKYRPYFVNFLKFKSAKEKQQFTDIACNDILIVDDVTTTGTTILEICRIIRNAGIDSKIIVFTVLGNDTLY
jgi:hypothetical protein